MKDWGISRRLNRISLPAYDRLYLLVALDHSLTDGTIKGLLNIDETLKKIDVSLFSGLIINCGYIHRLSIPSHISIIPQLVGAPFTENNKSRVAFSDIQEAISFNADSISVQINPYSKYFKASLQIITEIRRDAQKYSIPTLLMLNIPEDQIYSVEDFLKFIRSFTEFGFDVIKTPLPENIVNSVEIKEIVLNCADLVLSGGKKDERFFDKLALSKELGFRGVCVGRNIFQSTKPNEVLKSIIEVFEY